LAQVRCVIFNRFQVIHFIRVSCKMLALRAMILRLFWSALPTWALRYEATDSVGYFFSNDHNSPSDSPIEGTNETERPWVNWVAQPWGMCADTGCKYPVKSRTVECRMISVDKIVSRTFCDEYHPRPATREWCSCDLEVCSKHASSKCKEPEEKPPTAPFGGVHHSFFGPAGCFALADADEGANSSAPLHDYTCMVWPGDTKCRSGLPFYRNSEAAAPEECFHFCIKFGLDIFGIVNHSECRCGATKVNYAIWHNHQPHSSLIFDTKALQPLRQHCKHSQLRVFRYLGYFDMGSVPQHFLHPHVLDTVYIDSVVAGRRMSEISGEHGEIDPGEMEGEEMRYRYNKINGGAVRIAEHSGIGLPQYLKVTFDSALCKFAVGSLDGEYVAQGYSANGAAWYAKSTSGYSPDTYLYYDPDCNGGGMSEIRWIFDNEEPDPLLVRDLDNDGTCSYRARLDWSKGPSELPLGTNSFHVYCGGSGYEEVPIAIESVNLAPSPSLESEVCQDTDNGATDIYNADCEFWRNNVNYCHYVMYYDDTDFSGEDMCCACYGGSTKQSAKSPSPVSGEVHTTTPSAKDWPGPSTRSPLSTTPAIPTSTASSARSEATTRITTTTAPSHEAPPPVPSPQAEAQPQHSVADESLPQSPIQVTGDPHVINVRGERFNIMQTGSHVLMELPRGSKPHQVHLRVDADVEQFGDCHTLYMQGLRVIGKWLESPGFPGSLEFRAGGGNLSFGGPGIETGHALLRAGNITVSSLAEFSSLLPRALAEVSETRLPKRPSKPPGKRIRTLAVKLLFPRGVTVLVSFVRTHRSLGRGHVDHLDFAVLRLGVAGFEVGGLLGLDSHVAAATVPDECRGRKTESLLGIGREVLNEDDYTDAASAQILIDGRLIPHGSFASYE